MKITFIFHSSFAVELEKNILIFDYYGGGKLPDFPAGKKIHFLNSHGHPDHFKREILDLMRQYPDAEYILSSDIRLHPEERGQWVHSVKANETYCFGELKISTLKSTDVGVAFVVETEGKAIYHAGDLNWWHWDGEDKAWNHNMAANYQRTVGLIAGRHFDAAFVPLDPRLGYAFHWGMKYFLEQVSVSAVFPMHCWEDYTVCRRVREEKEMQGLLDHFMEVAGPGQEWNICW